MIEIWKDIPGYEGFYQVSNLGRVKSLPRKGWMERNKCWRLRKNRIFKLSADKSGYVRVLLRLNCKPKSFSVHRLVLISFVGESNLQVNHKNGIKDDNRLENLEYCTQSENTKHAYESGLALARRGEKSSLSKLTGKDILSIRSLYKTGKYKQCELADMHNIKQPNVSDIINMKTWKHI